VGLVYEFKLHLALNEQEALRGMNIMASKIDGCDAALKLSHALFGKFLITGSYLPQALSL
jgi:hypothetical protein